MLALYMKQLLEEIGKTNVCFKETPSFNKLQFFKPLSYA